MCLENTHIKKKKKLQKCVFVTAIGKSKFARVRYPMTRCMFAALPYHVASDRCVIFESIRRSKIS